jgi:hypothetical protein
MRLSQRGPRDRQQAPEGARCVRTIERGATAAGDAGCHGMRPLIAMMQVGGEHSVEIEALQANAWLAICTLVESLEKHRGATDDRWERAISNVETLEKLLI